MTIFTKQDGYRLQQQNYDLKAEIERLRAALKQRDEFLHNTDNWDEFVESLHRVGDDVITVYDLQAVHSDADKCQKCGNFTHGEMALVDGQIWCHPCADEQQSVKSPNGDK